MYGTPSSRVEGTPRSGVRGTPARQRPDLGSVRKAPQVDLHSEPVSGEYSHCDLCLRQKKTITRTCFRLKVNVVDNLKAIVIKTFHMFLQQSGEAAALSELNPGQRLVIWGTDVNVGTCKEKFQV